MKRYLLCAGLILGMTAAAAAQTMPRPKSQDEQKALQAMFAATDPDVQIAAANTVLEKFADTDFKSIALFFISRDYQAKGDFAKSVTYGERSLEADPKNYQAMLVVASEYARNTKDSDFDKEDKLKKADKLSNDAIATVKTAPKPNPNMDDATWEGARKDITASAYEILGQVAIIRKKPELAATDFQTALDTASVKDPATYVRLAMADNMLNKPDEAIAAAEKAMNAPGAAPAVKQFAQAERARAIQAKGGAKPGAAPGATPGATPAPASTPAPAAPPQQ